MIDVMISITMSEDNRHLAVCVTIDYIDYVTDIGNEIT